MEGSIPTKQENGPEVIKTPEIVVQEEKGAQLLSLILKARDPKWSNAENLLAKETEKYFEANPLDKETSEFLDEIKALQKDGVDEETLYNLALTYGHSERESAVFGTIEKYKEHVIRIINPQELQQKLFKAMQTMEQSFSTSPLVEKFNKEAEEDTKVRLENLEETKEKIKKIIDFFKPDSKTAIVKKVSLMPTDPLYNVNSGYGFNFGEETVLKTDIKNPDNLEHEFCHGIINPIVDKLFAQLTDEQKEKISELANQKLKQDYGRGGYSLLCEEFIRTYNDVLKIGRKPETFEDFQRKIASIDDKEFQKFLLQSENFKLRCDELEIKTIEDLKVKSQEYFEQFEKNQLRDLIFKFYQDYVNRLDKNEYFEQFVLDNFATVIQ
jgi:hypothetical protein